MFTYLKKFIKNLKADSAEKHLDTSSFLNNHAQRKIEHVVDQVYLEKKQKLILLKKQAKEFGKEEI